jgi:hypothetical protein
VMPKGLKVTTTPQQDEVIRKCWEHNSYGHHAAKRAEELTGLSPDVVSRRATELGLVFRREKYRWTEPELKVLEENAHLALATIQKKLRLCAPPGVKRTRAAISYQIGAQRLRTNLDGLNRAALADALGISIERLDRLRLAGCIKGERLESLRQACGYVDDIRDENRRWFFHNDEIVRFVFECRAEIDLKKVNQVWFMSLLEGYITLFQPVVKDLPQSQKMIQYQKRIEVLEQFLAEAEQELAELCPQPKRRQGRPTKAESEAMRRRSSGTPHGGCLDEATVQSIRAGKKLRRGLRASGVPSNGDPSSPLGSTGTGMESRPNGSANGTLRSESVRAISPTVSLSSGCVGGISAGLPIVRRIEGDSSSMEQI